MSDEVKSKLIALLSEAETLKANEASLKVEKQRHQETIVTSEGEVNRCNSQLDDIKVNQMRLKREMDGLRDQIFLSVKDESEEVIVVDNTHVVTDGEGQKDSVAKRAWDARAKHLKQVQ